MFRFLELELHGWDFWPSLRVPLDADIVVLSGPNGSGKTTLLDAVRQILHAPRLSHGRRLAHYLRRPNQPVLLRAVVSNRPDEKGRRPFDRNRVFSDEATLACALVPDGGSPDKRYVVLPKNEREGALSDWHEADRAVHGAKSSLDARKNDLSAREKELDGTRTALEENERRRAEIEPQIEALSEGLDPALASRAGESELSTPEMAERDLRQAKDSLARFEAEGPIPEESVREERKVLLRNVEELERHVRERQEEADSAALELSRCRADYLDVVRSTLFDYSRRARALAEMAAARLEVELPRLENDDRTLDEAGIVVRIGFDGKPPVEISDTSHSGGQQVVTGLILLMAMAETEGESCFIVDEPFAHLSLDRVDDVGKFLRRSGSQFLITVPTTLDRGQLDPASLLIVLKKKASGEPFAPRPLVARE